MSCWSAYGSRDVQCGGCQDLYPVNTLIMEVGRVPPTSGHWNYSGCAVCVGKLFPFSSAGVHLFGSSPSRTTKTSCLVGDSLLQGSKDVNARLVMLALRKREQTREFTPDQAPINDQRNGPACIPWVYLQKHESRVLVEVGVTPKQLHHREVSHQHGKFCPAAQCLLHLPFLRPRADRQN